MEKRTIAYILIGTAVVIGGGTGVYFVGKKNGWFGDGEAKELDPLAQNGDGGGGNVPVVTTNNGGGGGSTSNGGGGGSTTQQTSGTVWDEVYLPNKDLFLSELSNNAAKKLFQYTINQVFKGRTTGVDGKIGPATRLNFYEAMKIMYPANYSKNIKWKKVKGKIQIDANDDADIKGIMGKLSFNVFIFSATNYVYKRPATANEIKEAVNRVPKSAVGLSGIFGLGMFGMS